MGLNWKGNQLKSRMRRAEISAVNTTMAAAVIHAKSGHGEGSSSVKQRSGAGNDPQATATEARVGAGSPVFNIGGAGGRRYQNQLGNLSRSIDIVQPAQRDGKGVTGTWGSRDVVYALRIELGFQGKDSLGRVYDQPAFPFLRPAANAEHPKLGNRIRTALAL